MATAGGATHTLPVRFGFRQIVQVGDHYELNGVRVNFRGDSLQGANYDSIRPRPATSATPMIWCRGSCRHPPATPDGRAPSTTGSA